MGGGLPVLRILDTFHAAESFLLQCCDETATNALAAWERYAAHYPELQRKCCENQGEQWREIFVAYVLPRLCEDRDKMRQAHENLLDILPPLMERCTGLFETKDTINMVIYVGLGNGAGWATEYEGSPAILFGLENIAALNWDDKLSLQYLAAHELCHLVHQALYGTEQWLALYESESASRHFRLYAEGFAERYQELLLSRPIFDRYGAGWLAWCQANHRKICSIYLKRLRECESVSDFYGNWNQVEGHSDVGYYLGREFIVFLEGKGLSIESIATMPEDKILCHVEEYLA